jgi:hypothetical protein
VANNYISKIYFDGTTYFLKDEELRKKINSLSAPMSFEGIVSSAIDITKLTTYQKGQCYKASSSFTIEDLGSIENGDMLVCIDNCTTGIFVAEDWVVLQNNVDTMVGATSSTAGTRGLVPAPKVGDDSKYLCGDGSWKSISVPWGNISDLT